MLNNTITLRAISLTLLPFFFCNVALAQDSTSGLAACAAEEDDQLRLACFDRESATPVAGPEEAVVVPALNNTIETVKTTAAASSLPAQNIADTVTESLPIKPAAVTSAAPIATTATTAAGPSDSRQLENVDEFSAIVTEVARLAHGEHIIYLDNGQVWSEQTANSYFPVDVGDTITINKRRYGGHRLLTESGRSFNMKQLR